MTTDDPLFALLIFIAALSFFSRIFSISSDDETEEDLTDKAQAVSDIFNQLRFDRETHLGNGDIHLSKENQRKILDLLSK